MTETKELSLNQKQVMVLKELRRQLNGKCGHECPGHIAIDLFGLTESPMCIGNPIWSERYCDHYFLFLKPNQMSSSSSCPCGWGVDSDIILTRLDEVIEELEDKLEELTLLGEWDEMNHTETGFTDIQVVGEVQLDTNNMPDRLRVNGVVYELKRS